jgi:hypothetical protein
MRFGSLQGARARLAAQMRFGSLQVGVLRVAAE